MPRPHICHVTSVHIPLDGRIFYHECRTLASRYDVTLVCRHNGPPETVHGVRIAPAASRSGGRLARWRDIRAVVRAAERTGANVYHFHDPELLGAMSALRRRTGKPVIYDAHEHYPLTVRLRGWIPGPLRPLAAFGADMTERRHAPRLDAVVVADDALAERFADLSDRVVTVRNYPPLDLFGPRTRVGDPSPTIGYIGSLSPSRGFDDMISVTRLVRKVVPGTRLVLAGTPTEELVSRIADVVAGDQGLIEFLGPVPYDRIGEVLARFDVGLSLLTDQPKYHKNIPTKVFDYMAASVPYVASDLPPLRAATHGTGGRLVPAGDVEVAAAAVAQLLDDSTAAAATGAEGRALVEHQLNWESQAQDLFDLYEELLAPPA
jgi:hypothetical protein